MILQALMFIASAGALAAYVCRLDALSWRKHRATWMIAHLTHAATSAWVMTEAAQDRVTWFGGFLLFCALFWLAISFRSWRHGPPAYAFRPGHAPVRVRRVWFEA